MPYKDKSYYYKTKRKILYYYEELFQTSRIQSISEIANELGISKSSVANFISSIYHGPNIEGKFSRIDLYILLCTKFGSSSPYLDDQRFLMEKIERRRLLVNSVREFAKIQAEKDAEELHSSKQR